MKQSGISRLSVLCIMLAQLIPVDGGEPIDIKRDVTLVGRKEGACDLMIEQSSVSKLHCLIVKTDGLLFVRDLGSTNGTKVNGQRVTRGALLPGDELAFAAVRFRVRLGPSEVLVSPDEPTEMIAAYSAAESDDSSSEPALFGDERSSDSDVQLIPDDT